MFLLLATICPASADSLLARTHYAEVRGDPKAGNAGARAAELIDEAVPRLAPLVGTSDLNPISARVYLDRATFAKGAGIPQNAPIVGIATFPSGIIHIDATDMLESIERIVPHEVAHVLIARCLGPSLDALPTWLNEGIAEYAAGTAASQVDPVALQAVGRGEAIPLASLDASFHLDNTAQPLAYAEAASLVNFMVAKRGPSVIRDLLGAVRSRHDFPSSLMHVTGWNMEELESGWRQSVSRRWRWYLFFYSQAPILGLMVLLFVIGYLRYRYDRRRRQEMPDTDW